MPVIKLALRSKVFPFHTFVSFHSGIEVYELSRSPTKPPPLSILRYIGCFLCFPRKFLAENWRAACRYLYPCTCI